MNICALQIFVSIPLHISFFRAQSESKLTRLTKKPILFRFFRFNFLVHFRKKLFAVCYRCFLSLNANYSLQFKNLSHPIAKKCTHIFRSTVFLLSVYFFILPRIQLINSLELVSFDLFIDNSVFLEHGPNQRGANHLPDW